MVSFARISSRPSNMSVMFYEARVLIPPTNVQLGARPQLAGGAAAPASAGSRGGRARRRPPRPGDAGGAAGDGLGVGPGAEHQRAGHSTPVRPHRA